MDLTRPWTRALAGVCALTLLVAACGDDDDGDSSSDTTEQTTAATDETTESTEAAEETTASEPEEETTTSEAEEGDPEAVATAEAINLKIEDFADGWVEEEESDETEGEDDFNECFTTVDVEATTVGEAETPTFSAETPDGQGGQAVSMQTIVFDSPESATAVLAEVATPEFAACTQGSLTEDSVEGAGATLAPTVDDPPLAEESVGLAGTVEIPAEDGATQQGRVDLHAIRTGAVASFTFTIDIGATPATGFEQTLAELYTIIAQRQAAEAG